MTYGFGAYGGAYGHGVARRLQTLALDFTKGVLDPRITFTRASIGTYRDLNGVLQLAASGAPRFDFDGTRRRLLIESARTNILLNSLLDGTPLSTQTVAVTAQAYTLSFYGTGTIDLSGAHTANVVGTGAYPARKTLTFTPSAGNLTLTVTGTVQFAQLAAGPRATSFIPTAGAPVTRALEKAEMTGTNFSSWFNPLEGTFVVRADAASTANSDGTKLLVLSKASDPFNTNMFVMPNTVRQFQGNNAGTQWDIDAGTPAAGALVRYAAGYKANDIAISLDGGAPVADTSATIPAVDQLRLGAATNDIQFLDGGIASLEYYAARLPQLQALSA